MHKYHIKFSKFWLVIFILVLVIAFVTLSLNIILAASKNKLALSIEKYFSRKITIGHIIYLPPNFIIFKDISVQEPVPPIQNPSLFLPTICMKLSLWEVAIKKRLSVSDIYIYEPKADYLKFRLFLKDNFKQIMAFIHSLPKQDINLFIKKMELDFPKEDIGFKYLTADFTLKIKGSSVSSFGSINRNMTGNTGMKFPLRYGFAASWTQDGISLENLELQRENFYSQLKGSYKGNVFRLSGFAFMNTLFKESEHEESALNTLEGFRFSDGSTGVPLVSRLPQANLFILDIDCRGNFTFPKLQIEHLQFSLNNNPVSLKGNIFLSDPISLDLAISSYLTNLKYEQAGDIEKVELKIKGTLKENVFNSGGILNLDSIKKKKGGFPLERLELAFNGLTFYFAQYPNLKMHLGDSNLFLQTDKNEYKVFLKNLNAIFYLRDEKFKFVDFNSPFYDGFLRGRARIDTAKWPPIVTSMVRLRNVSANKLDGLLIHFSKFHGKLASQMYFSNFPRIFLKGNMVMQKGYLYNLQFFKWLADFFDLPALKKISFKRAASNFLVNEEGVSLREMSLESKDVNLNGYFSLGHNDLVSSKISLAFTRGLLQESSKFTPLLKLLGKDVHNLVFDFQLSGNLHKMNFQWLQSDFKRRIQASIPHFMERKIDRNIGNIIEPLSSKQQE